MGMFGLRAAASQHKCRSCIPKAPDFKTSMFSIHLSVDLLGWLYFRLRKTIWKVVILAEGAD